MDNSYILYSEQLPFQFHFVTACNIQNTMDAGYTRTPWLFSTASGNGPVVVPDVVENVNRQFKSAHFHIFLENIQKIESGMLLMLWK